MALTRIGSVLEAVAPLPVRGLAHAVREVEGRRHRLQHPGVHAVPKLQFRSSFSRSRLVVIFLHFHFIVAAKRRIFQSDDPELVSVEVLNVENNFSK